MISSLTGELKRVDDDRVHLSCGAMVYELLVPAADLTELQASLGETITFHTLFYVEGDASGGNLTPRLIGFLRVDDKRFFEKFITVKGIGPKTALKAFTIPVGEIARAIEMKDTRALLDLKGVGRRTAELIVAELSGKVASFVMTTVEKRSGRRSADEEAAIAVLASPQMGLRRVDAERLLDAARESNPNLKSAEQLVSEMLRLHAIRG